MNLNSRKSEDKKETKEVSKENTKSKKEPIM